MVRLGEDVCDSDLLRARPGANILHSSKVRSVMVPAPCWSFTLDTRSIPAVKSRLGGCARPMRQRGEEKINDLRRRKALTPAYISVSQESDGNNIASNVSLHQQTGNTLLPRDSDNFVP